jgi:hypothetical protein
MGFQELAMLADLCAGADSNARGTLEILEDGVGPTHMRLPRSHATANENATGMSGKRMVYGVNELQPQSDIAERGNVGPFEAIGVMQVLH